MPPTRMAHYALLPNLPQSTSLSTRHNYNICSSIKRRELFYTCKYMDTVCIIIYKSSEPLLAHSSFMLQLVASVMCHFDSMACIRVISGRFKVYEMYMKNVHVICDRI